MKIQNKTSHIPPAAVVLLLIVPLCSAVLKPIHTSVSGDVLLTVWANILSITIAAAASVSLYGALGYIVKAVRDGRSWWQFAVMYAVGLLLVYGSGIVAYRLYLTPEAFKEAVPYTLTTDLLNIGIEVVLFAVTIIVTRHISARGASVKRLTAVPVLVCLVNSAVWAIASTTVDIVSVGLPINLTEVVYLLTPYAIIAVTALLGYFIVWRILGGGKAV